jgi:hypothetical protein
VIQKTKVNSLAAFEQSVSDRIILRRWPLIAGGVIVTKHQSLSAQHYGLLDD